VASRRILDDEDTSITAMVSLPNAGTGWQSENGHPFAVG
jgi:hypothetical protein